MLTQYLWLLILTALVLPTSTTASTTNVANSLVCEGGWSFNDANNKCYKYYAVKKTFNQAVAEAKKVGAEISMAKDKAENDFIHNLIKNDKSLGKISPFEGIWLNAQDSFREGYWVWYDGGYFTWNNFMSGQPSNGGKGKGRREKGEDCLTMRYDGKWNDAMCDHKTYFRYVAMKPSVYGCRPGWSINSGNKMCYLYRDTITTYRDAVADCEELGAELAMAKNKAEHDFLHNMIKMDKSFGKISEYEGIWLHASDRLAENKWVWGDGTKVNWFNWQTANHAHRTSPNGEDCLSMMYGGLWNDAPCEHKRYFRRVCMTKQGGEKIRNILPNEGWHRVECGTGSKILITGSEIPQRNAPTRYLRQVVGDVTLMCNGKSSCEVHASSNEYLKIFYICVTN